MSGDKRALLKQWLESGQATLSPLTFPQRELWEASPVPPGDPSNHICCFINVNGAILPEDCRTAVQRVVDRQEVLRLSVLPGKERPLQMIRSTGEANVCCRELTATQAQPEAIEETAAALFAEPFDLVQGPLYRVHVLSRSKEEHVMVLSIHHAIADGWTLGVFIRDLCGAYLQERMGLHEPLPPVELSYTAWGAAERALWPAPEIESRAGFWRSELSGSRRLWNVPEPAPGAPALLRRQVSHIPAPLATAARELARQNGVTLFSTLLTVFQITLAQWTGQEDIVVGSPVANRSRQATRETMGYFAGNVPLRGQVDSQRPFRDALQATHHSTVDCFANAMPFAELIQVLNDKPAPGYNPVYQVRFALQNHPIPDVSLPALSAKLRMRSTGTPRFDLGCEVTEEGETMEVVWLFRAQQFSPDEIVSLDQRFQAALSSACRSPGSRSSVIAASRT